MRKSKLISVRVPEDILYKLDEKLKKAPFSNRSDVICTLLDIAASTLSPSQLDRMTRLSTYLGNYVDELLIKFKVYGKKEEVHFVNESQKGTDN